MIIALLAVLGVDLIVIVVLAGGVLSRRLWVRHQPQVFKGAIRVTDGQVHGLSGRWHHGYGRWVREVLVWTPAPLLLRNVFVAVDGATRPLRPTDRGETRRIGADPKIASFASDEATIEVATAGKNSRLLSGPAAAAEPLVPGEPLVPAEPPVPAEPLVPGQPPVPREPPVPGPAEPPVIGRHRSS